MTSKRSDVVNRVVMMPMMVHMQREDDLWIVTMPNWHLNSNIIVEAPTEKDAMRLLEQKMYDYWNY